MKKNFILSLLSLALFIGYSPVQAQTQEVQPGGRLSKLGLRNIGATFGFGTADMNLSEMNGRLQALEVGRLDDMLTAFNFSIYTDFEAGFGFSLDVSGGTSFVSELYDTNTMMHFGTFTFGPTMYYSLLKTNRIRLMALGGLRTNDMSFKYNAKVSASPDFDDLLANPAANSNVVALQSTSTESAIFGARFQYRLGKKENLTLTAYSIGLDTGYNYGFETVAWREPQSNYIVRDMPAIKPDYFYLNFTFSALLKR